MKVSIVIPAYNAEAGIGVAIGSALEQEGVEVDVLVVDHGSSDNTKLFAESFSALGTVEVLSLVRAPDERRSASRPLNAGVQKVFCKCEAPSQHWVLRLDADDFLVSSSCIGSMLRYAKGRRLLIGSLVFFDEVEKVAETYSVHPSYRTKDALIRASAYSVPHHATLVRVDLLWDVVEKRGYAFDQGIGYGEDLDLTLELLKTCAEEDLCFVDQPVVYKRLDGATVSHTSSLVSIALDHVRIFSRHHLMFGELAWRSFADIGLRLLKLGIESLRVTFGYPGRRWAFMKEMSIEFAVLRLEELKSKYPRV